VLICVDELGPLNLQPRPGRGWRPVRRPGRQRATTGAPTGCGTCWRARPGWREFLAFRKQLRRRWPGEKLYLIVDNLSPHLKTEVRDWCADHDVERVFTPTNASWLNWLE